ncbi:MAG: nickel-dependent hydrogenase large subunit, partial [Myxococcales bacterium]|nr:nickel-dependent hydrogenase large subunit [Myxococcales bacterium]
LHAPDFLGFESALHMAEEHGPWVQKGLRIKKAGNAIVGALGGREIHPINVRVGGFYRWPAATDLRGLLEPLARAQGDAEESLRWMASFDFPDLERDYELVALQHAEDYPFCEGRIVSNKGLDIDVRDYLAHFQEEHVAHSTALHARHVGHGPYLVGPLARINTSFERLGRAARDAAAAIGFEPPCHNPFKSILARGIELIQVLDEAQRIIENHPPVGPAFTPYEPRAGVGHGATEAPRGLLYHRYRLAEDGTIAEATIVPPTSQNQATIEDDLRHLAPSLAAMPLEDATQRAEQAVRNYDPCISCSTHFLKLRIEGA